MKTSHILKAIHDIQIAVRSRKSVHHIMSLILERGCTLANATRGSFCALDENQKEVYIVCNYGPDWTAEKMSFRTKVGEGITGLVASTGKMYICHDVQQDSHYIELFPHVKSEAVFPILVDEKLWGVLNLRSDQKNAFDEETIEAVEIFVELAAAAIGLKEEMIRQERLQQYLMRTEKLAALGNILAGVAHEINNPLTAILGHASLLKMHNSDTPVKISLEAIISESNRVAKLVKDLLGFARKSPVQIEPCNLRDVIEEMCSLVRYQFQVKGRLLITELETVPPILIDPNQFRQILLNLISNAEHALPEDQKGAFVRIQTVLENDLVFIHIVDNGIGVPEDIQDKILEPFFTTKPVGKGTGLGLSIAKTIVETYGGSLTFKSLYKQGTTFSISFPVAQADEIQKVTHNLLPATQEMSNLVVGRNPKVLVIDDEELLLTAVVQYLRNHGFVIEATSNVTEALEKLQKDTFDLILTDIRLPGKDGIEFYDEVCKLLPEYQKRFVFMSGDLIRDVTRELVEKTGCSCLHKPFSFHNLKETLFNQMEKAS